MLHIDIELVRGGFRRHVRIDETSRVVALTGPSGAGKSSVLNAIAGLLRPRSGRIEIDGREPRRIELRTQIGFQRPVVVDAGEIARIAAAGEQAAQRIHVRARAQQIDDACRQCVLQLRQPGDTCVGIDARLARRQRTGEQAQQRGLAAAVGADQCDGAAWQDEFETGEQRAAVVAHGRQVSGAQDRGRHGSAGAVRARAGRRRHGRPRSNSGQVQARRGRAGNRMSGDGIHEGDAPGRARTARRGTQSSGGGADAAEHRPPRAARHVWARRAGAAR